MRIDNEFIYFWLAASDRLTPLDYIEKVPACFAQ